MSNAKPNETNGESPKNVSKIIIPDALTLDEAEKLVGKEKAVELYRDVAKAGGFGDFPRMQEFVGGTLPALDLKGLKAAAEDENNPVRELSQTSFAAVEAVFAKVRQ